MADIDLLRTFLSVYRAGTFTRAARELHLSQPAVSLQIRALETHVGKPLFRRAARGVSPTAAGRELAQAVAPHVDALEGMIDPAREAGESIGESVHIGGPEEFLGVRVLPELVPLMHEGLRVRMYFGVDEPVVERLVAGEIDLAITTVEVRRRGLDTRPLCFEYLDLVAAPELSRAVGAVPEGPAGAALLADVPLAAYDEDLPLARLYWQSVFDTPIQLRATLVANSLRAALQFAVQGAGMAVLPSHLVDEALAAGRVVHLLEPVAPARSRLWLAWRSGTLRRPSLARVHERIRLAAPGW